MHSGRSKIFKRGFLISQKLRVKNKTKNLLQVQISYRGYQLLQSFFFSLPTLLSFLSHTLFLKITVIEYLDVTVVLESLSLTAQLELNFKFDNL